MLFRHGFEGETFLVRGTEERGGSEGLQWALDSQASFQGKSLVLRVLSLNLSTMSDLILCGREEKIHTTFWKNQKEINWLELVLWAGKAS